MNIRPFIEKEGKLSAVIFMSGTGSNAEKLLEKTGSGGKSSWVPAVIVTDCPETSRASEIAGKFNIPLISHGIKKYYSAHGESRVSLKTPEGRKIRKLWTKELRRLIKPFAPDFGILAGFVPLTNITSDFPCLNVHPGDLTVERDGKRLLAGLHTVPVEAAIINGFKVMRTSVIIAQPYTGKGGEMDSGPVLGVSPGIDIDFMGFSGEELEGVAATRPATRPFGGYGDSLEEVALFNQEKLKKNGDWVVFPAVVEDFAAGKYGTDENGRKLFYFTETGWRHIITVERGEKTKKLFFP
jgi:folate-dependent phosphoribosylglycinamide formyltransferase PurN